MIFHNILLLSLCVCVGNDDKSAFLVKSVCTKNLTFAIFTENCYYLQLKATNAFLSAFNAYIFYKKENMNIQSILYVIIKVGRMKKKLYSKYINI